MDNFVAGTITGALLFWIVGVFSGRFAGRRPTPAVVTGPAPAPAPSDGLDTIVRPELRRLIELRTRVENNPRAWRADDMLDLVPFRDMVDAFADPGIGADTLLSYRDCDDVLFAWTALCALALRPREDEAERRLLARLNSFHPWTRHYSLRVLEAWNPEDPGLAGRVLVGLDNSWTRDDTGVILDQFLRRRAAIAPPSLEGVTPPAGFDGDPLGDILRTQVDPAIARPLLESLPALVALAAAGVDGSAVVSEPGEGPIAHGPLSEMGRLWRPSAFKDDGAIGYPAADALLERAHATLTGAARRGALIVGDPGVGKTSLVRRLATRLSAEGWTLFEASAGQINAGMSYVGQLEARMRQLQKALARPNTLWIAPDFHQLLWAGRHNQSPVGLLEMLVPMIEAGEILILGETRPEGLERVLIERPEIGRLFETIRIEPPSPAETEVLLGAWAGREAERRRVALPAEVRTEAAALARQYLSGHAAPGGVLRLLERALEEAAPRANAERAATLGMDDVVSALARLSGLPLDVLDERRTLDLESVRRRFESRVMGQPEAVRLLVERLALLKAGVTDPSRPTGVFLFAGASGTGKTELAKTLADYLFGSPERLARLDMSELQDAGGLERVVGSTLPVAAGSGNSLAERVRRQPFSVVLLDEFEKAHPRVWDLFLQVFDDGRLTDARGETADFRQTIIILTSNLGMASSGEARLGLVSEAEGFSPGVVERAVERAFKPELRNRLDRVVVFRPLTRDVMRLILRKELADAFARRGLRRRGWAVELEESAIELLIERGFSPTLGARPLRRALEQLLLTPLAAAIVERRAPERDQFLFVRADGEALTVEFVDPDAPAAGAVMGAPSDGELASIAFEAHGTREEVETLRAALAQIQARVSDPVWSGAKEALLLESATPGFWKRPDRFDRLGRAEYFDRIESGARGAASLLERLQGKPDALRAGFPRELVSRLAQQVILLDLASHEALDSGPRDAFLSIEPQLEDHAVAGPALEFARRIAAMYEGWARARGMRLAGLERPGDEHGGARHLLAVAGFAAFALLAPEDGLHVFEWDEPGTRNTRRATVRVRVVAQPATPARDGAVGLRRQAQEALTPTGASAPRVARRYREGDAPLVRDAVRGWRTGRIDRVLAGDFDLIPTRE